MATPPRILTIAGSDPSGGAGIQADIKTITMMGGYAVSAITAITVQNTLGVQAVEVLAPELVVAQIAACVSDIGIDAIKIGMLGSAANAHAVADVLAGMTIPVVFDPVMIATSGGVLADAETVAAFTRLMRLATVTTPNLPELAALGGEAAMLSLTHHALIKGGHGEGEVVVDRLIGPAGEVTRWSDPRIDTQHTHGTGCTLASAIAVGLGSGLRLEQAITEARQFVRAALIAAPGFGQSHGPIGHYSVR